MRETSTNNMLRLTSDPKNVEKIEHFVELAVAKFRVAPDAHGNILVSLTEAVNNAIIHGNRLDRSKTVEVRLHKRGDGLLSLVVRDEGKGFDYKNLPDPTAIENRCTCGGRGVFLMRQLSDGIKFRENGRCVEMEFKI
jgi:serine/threonine-protein kinase RsbW